MALAVLVDGQGRTASLDEARADDRLRRLHAASTPELHSGSIARQATQLAVSCALPTRDVMFRSVGYGAGDDDAGDDDAGDDDAGDDDRATIALIHGEPAARELPLVHVHVACLLGDTFGSLLCDCRDELDRAVDAIAADGAGVIIYARTDNTDPTACARRGRVDGVLVAGLPNGAGVHRLRLLDGDDRLRDELRGCGLEVAS